MSEALLTFLREHQGLPFRTVTVFNYLLEAAIFGGLLILLLLAARRLLRGKLGSRAIYVAWLLVAARLLVPLALPNPVMNDLKPVRSSNEAARPVADQIRVRLQDAAMELGQSIDPEHAGVIESDGRMEVTPAALIYHLGVYTSYGWTGKWLFFLYLAGAAATAGWMLLQNLLFRRRWKRSLLDEPGAEIMAEYHQCCEALGVKRPPAVRLADPLPNACLVGFFRPVIAVSAVLPEQDMRLALRHELAHYRAGDNWWGLLRNLCCCVQWFNPLVWVGAWVSRQDGELACDERVTCHMATDERRAYAETLLRAAARRTSPGLAVCATGLTVSGKRLQARIADILRRRAVRRGAVIGFAVIAVAAVAMAFCTAGTETGRVALANFDGITHLTEAQETAPHALLEPMEITHESEAISRFLSYMRTGLFGGAGYGVWMTERDANVTVMPVEGGWYVMMNVVGGVSQMLLDQRGELVSYRVYIRNATRRFRGSTPNNLDEAALSYVRRLAVGCLGAEVTAFRREGLNAIPGFGVLFSGTAEIDGAPCSFEMDMSSMAFIRFERTGGVAKAPQSPIDVYQRLVAWTEKQLAWSTKEPCERLTQVIRDGEKLIGVVSLRADLCDADTRRALVDGWGEAARHTLLLTFDPWGKGYEDIRLSEEEPVYPGEALSEGILALEKTVYDLVEGRWLSQAGVLPAGTTYEVLTETTSQALGVVPAMPQSTELTLLRYVRPDGTSDVGWICHAKAEDTSYPAIVQMETLTVTSSGQRYSVQAYDARAIGAFDEPSGTRMEPGEAVGLAMDAVLNGYAVTAEKLLAEAVSYGYREEDILWNHYWQIDFHVDGWLYEIYVRDSDGEILNTCSPGESNG